MKKLLLFISIILTGKLSAQTIKIENDSVIVYCKYDDLKRAIKLEYSYSETRYWVTENGQKKEIVEKFPPKYQDSLLALNKTPSDTITLSNDDWFNTITFESQRLLKENKLTFFDKRNHKNVTHVKIKKNAVREDSDLYDLYIDAETKNKLYLGYKKSFGKF